MKLLVISDIHANFPALKAVADQFSAPFDLILNGGDSTVYGPFPNQTINWLRQHGVRSILGNTDRLVLTLLGGGSFKKPRRPDKRIMYGWTASELTPQNADWLRALPLHLAASIDAGAPCRTGARTIGLFHGSPENPDEFLFADSPETRFNELAAASSHALVIIGHSHTPFHKQVGGVHFVNPGSVGRMFDGDPRASCAVIELRGEKIRVELHRLDYPVEEVVAELDRLRLPPIYGEMYRQGRKLN